MEKCHTTPTAHTKTIYTTRGWYSYFLLMATAEGADSCQSIRYATLYCDIIPFWQPFLQFVLIFGTGFTENAFTTGIASAENQGITITILAQGFQHGTLSITDYAWRRILLPKAGKYDSNLKGRRSNGIGCYSISHIFIMHNALHLSSIKSGPINPIHLSNMMNEHRANALSTSYLLRENPPCQKKKKKK